MPSVANMMGFISRLESDMVTVHQDRCVLVRNRNADCLRCAAVCTSGCISFADNELVISPEKCIGCGTCATVCPTCALEAHNPNDAQLELQCRKALQQEGGRICIACTQLLDRADGLYDPAKAVRVECLGRVEESMLTRLAADGVRTIELAHGDCANCPHANGLKTAQLVVDTERQLLEAWHCDARVRLSGKLPSWVRLQQEDDGFDPSRRAFFEQGGKDARAMGVRAVGAAYQQATGVPDPEAQQQPRYVKVMADGTLPHFLPDRRERLLDALAGLGEPEDVMISTRLWGHVVIDTEKCMSCQMCATFCPTGAIQKFQDADGTFGVEHYPGDCVKCRCCANICPANALEISEEVFAVDMLAGMTDRYVMKPVAVKRSQAHTIVNVMRSYLNIEEVYER